MIKESRLTTIDNPYDPFDQFHSWFMFDIEKGYNSCGYLGRIAKTSDQLSEEGGVSSMKELSGESLKTIDEVVARHKDDKGPVIVMLHEVQDNLGYIPFEAMEKIGLDTPESRLANATEIKDEDRKRHETKRAEALLDIIKEIEYLSSSKN